MITQLAPNLFCGSQSDLSEIPKDWAVVHACKEPHHRQMLNYTGRGAPKDHPEYLFGRRDNRLILNLVDAADPKYIPAEIIREAINFMTEHEGKPIFVHCNEGRSRGPGIAMLYMGIKKLLPSNYFDAKEQFKKIYPAYNPARGIDTFLEDNWKHYVKG